MHHSGRAICIRTACILAFALLITGCKPRPKAAAQADPTSVAVSVVTLHAKPITLTTVLPGRTSAYRIAEVRPQVNGLILNRLFTEGDEVQAGQQLYQIDPGLYQATLDSAKASLQKARATVVVAQQTVDRARPLARALAISRQELDNAVATLLQGQADVAAGQAAVQTANINLAYTKVLSPISGHAGRSSVTEGALVTADQSTSLVTITQLDPIYVDVTQPTTTLLRLKQELASGQLQRAGGYQTEVHLLLDQSGEYPQAGRLKFSEVNVDENTGTVTLRAVFPNPDGLLLPGMFVRERIQEGISPRGLLVPQQSVTRNPQGQATTLIVGAGQQGGASGVDGESSHRHGMAGHGRGPGRGPGHR